MMETVTSQPETSDKIQLRIDDFSTRKINLFTTVITLLVGLVFLLAISAPDSIVRRDRGFASCDEALVTQLGYTCETTAFPTNDIVTVGINANELASTSHRFLVLGMSPIDLTSQGSTTITAEVEVSAFVTDDKPELILNKNRQTLVFDCSQSQKETCDSQELAIFESIQKGSYYFVVKFINAEDFAKEVKSFEVHSNTWNTSYRNYRFAVKLIFVIITILGYLWYTREIKGLKSAFHTREQKLIKFIIPILVTVNEPITYHLFSGFMYVTMTATQVFALTAVLLWLWMPFLDEIAGTMSSVIERTSKFSKIYIPIYFLFGWLTYILYCNKASHDPVHFFNSAPGAFYNFMKYSFLAVLLVGIGWILYKSFFIVQRLDELTQRESTFFCYNAVFILCQFYLLARGGADPFSFDGTKAILFAGLNTVYVFGAAYLFIPTAEGVAQATHKQKYDNPVANAAYKDLDESDDKPKHVAVTSNPDLERGVSGASATTNDPLDKKYPYEANHDDL